METLTVHRKTTKAAGGAKPMAIVGVVASGNLEVLVERMLAHDECSVEIATTAHGFGDVWEAVVEDFVRRYEPGGLRMSINDGGARPDTVALRLAQGVRLIEENAV